MQDDKGKVILSLLAGATAGIVAGLLLAPETGDDTRANLKRSASKWGGDLSKRFKDTLAKAQGQEPGHVNTNASLSEDKQAADRLLAGLDAPRSYPDADTDYDGSGDDFRHQPLL
ncbi:YtxH domain-containing protein [Hymenobacter properus]|uniref:YtxH domain-containing protein n=1 Tax=Hymenobacter properus TaxID=2791026 RepID=A0A931BG86_9BACT|nr:YtxH domain-containing protein [Hymenobacter properus]MBF9143360.1 YtxH domain-containing protein [Hymenobacter properus]MBR7722171.1 YtxH domain-containing protein [Microvirga sp. SRT04]